MKRELSEIKVLSGLTSYVVRTASLDNLDLIDFDFVLVDSNVHHFFASEEAKITTLQVSESIKTLSTVQQLCIRMAELGVSRNSRILAIGGGVIQDLATVAASIYHRGIQWSFIPSTLAAMVDSCVGGKSSLNLNSVKNVLGNFYPPSEILIVTELLETLPRNHMISGLSEAVKINFARGREQLGDFLANQASKNPGVDSQTEALILETLRAKIWFVERDEFDVAERKLLNFGHTFGHALEAVSNNAIPHGVAVALGMRAAAVFSELAVFPMRDALQGYTWWLLQQVDGLEAMTSEIDWDFFVRSLGADKKASKNEIGFVLPSATGGLEIVKFRKTRDTLERAQQAAQLAIKESKF